MSQPIGDDLLPATDDGGDASTRITGRIAALGDWRGAMLARVRRLVHEADPAIVEEWKWRGVPVWSLAGIVCTGESYQRVVKLTFARGASLDDPQSCSREPRRQHAPGHRPARGRPARRSRVRHAGPHGDRRERRCAGRAHEADESDEAMSASAFDATRGSDASVLKRRSRRSCASA